MFDLSDPASIGTLIGMAGGLGGPVYTFFSNRSKAASAEIDSLKKDIEELEKRLTTAEFKLNQMPDSEAIHRLELQLEKVNGQLETMSAKLAPIDNLSRRLQEILLQKVNA